MTRPRGDPFAYLPFAIPGLLTGLGLVLGCGYLALSKMSGAPSTETPPGHATIQGTVEWASWRQSAAPDGPTWFLQVRLADDPRGFLVSASDLSDAFREQQAQSGRARRSRRRLPALEGKKAIIVVDDRFQQRPRPPTPYMKALRIDGTVLVSRRADSPPQAPNALVVLLLGTGVLVGLGLASVSLHHLAVCVRHARRS